MTTNLNILHLSTAKIWRGAERQIVNLYSALQNNCNQYIVCPTDSPLALYCSNKNIAYHSIKMAGAIQPIAAYQLYNFVKKNKIDIIHTHDSHAINLFLVATYYGLQIPVVVSRRVDFEIGKSILSLWKYNHSHIKKIICVSDAIKAVISPKIKDKNKIITIYSGIDIHKIINKPTNNLHQYYGITEDITIVGTAAALVPHKDLHTFIYTAQRLQNHKFHFIIFGKGTEEKNIKTLINSLHLNNITFAGHRDDIIQCIKGMDIFLFTSKMEGLSTTLLDTMACKIPIVGTRAGGASEILKHRYNAMTADIGDSNTLSQHILTLQKEEDIRKQIIENAFTFVQDYDYTITAAKTLEIYRSVCIQ